MQKVVLCVAVVIVCVVLYSSSTVESASVGCPGIMPERGRYIMGFEYNHLKGRDLSDSNIGSQKIDVGSTQFIGKLLYGLSDRVALSIKGGSCDLDVWDPNNSVTHSHSGDLGWGLGFRTTFYEDLKLGLSIGAGAQYFAFEPKNTVNDGSAKWADWDSSLYFCIINNVDDSTPMVEPFALTKTSLYAGARYSDAKLDWEYSGASGTLEGADTFGFFGGFDFVFDDNYIMGIEARFSDETAYTGIIGLRF